MVGSHKKLKLKLNVTDLKEALDLNKSEFGKYPHRGEGNSPHSEMEDIWARYNDITPYLESNDFSTFGEEHDSVWYPVEKKLPVKELVFKIMEAVNGERLGGVLITKLKAGGKIAKHKDSGWHASYYDKYYVPIKNHEGSTFSFHDGVIVPDEGDVWWFDNSNFHWVDNNSDKDRIAMIVCIKTNNRLGE